MPKADAGPGIWSCPVSPGPLAHQHSATLAGPGSDPASSSRNTDFCATFDALAGESRVCFPHVCVAHAATGAASHLCISCPAAASVTLGLVEQVLYQHVKRGEGNVFGWGVVGGVCTNSSCQFRTPTHECRTCVYAVCCCESAAARSPYFGRLEKARAEVSLKYPFSEKHWECVAASLHMAATSCPRAQYHLRTRLRRCVSPTIDIRCM